MSTKATPLLIPVLREMSVQGMNNRALLLMQSQAVWSVMSAVKVDDSDVLGLAAKAIPDEHAYAIYNSSLASINKQEVRELERVGDHLKWVESHLERAYSRALASGAPLAQFAQRQGVIASVYAGVLREAKALEDDGVVAVRNSKTLTKLSERSDGPLGDIHDKAMAILEAKTQTHQRMST